MRSRLAYTDAMSLEILQLPQWQDNYAYLIADAATGEAAVVDAPEPGRIPELLKEKHWRLAAIFNTHHHPDHIGANAALLKLYPGLRVYGHTSDEKRIPGITDKLNDGDTVKLGNETARVVFVPGHTSGHIAYRFGNNLFIGDTLFAGGCGRLFEGTAAQMQGSLAKIRQLPDDTKIWCAHEYTQSNLRFAVTVEPGNRELQERVKEVADKRARNVSTVPPDLVTEKNTNPFLRWDSPEIIESAKKADPSAGDSVSVFAAIRKLKDRF